MEYLNLMQNKLKPREVNDALINGGGGGGSGVPDYSYDEVDTGVKWVDGRTIYCKCYPETAWTYKSFYKDSDVPIIDIPTGVDYLIDMSMIFYNGNAKVYWKPHAFAEDGVIKIGGLSTTVITGTFVLWYVKTETN